MKSKIIISTLLIVLVFILLPTLIYAQGGPGDPGGDPDPGTNVPIDGGLSVLLALGIGYGAKKVNDLRKKDKALPDIETKG